VAKSIKGIQIEIGGNTTSLKKALDDISKTTKSLKTELSHVDKALKLDPRNIELTKQKQQLLNEVIASTKDKLEAMQQAQAEAQRLMSEGTEVNQGEYRRLQREIVTTQEQLRGYENELANIASNLGVIGDQISGFGNKVTGVGKSIMPVSAAVAGLGAAAVKITADFDSSMSQVQATMGITKDAMSEVNDQTVNTMDTLSDLAKKMGTETAFSASECADALNYLALAGYDTQQMCDTLPTVLNLAAAGGIDLASASDMVTDAMSALGMEVSDANKMVDQMAKTSSKTNTSVAQLGEAILTIGSTAKKMKGGTAELNTALGILANSGTKGAEGGTKLRNIIKSLQSPTDKASECLKKLGVNAYDGSGKMRSLNKIFQNLNASMKEMTDEQKDNIINTIFNSRDASAALDLMASAGEKWNELEQAITDCSGAAQQMADTQLDNLKGQLTILKSALEGLAISIGELLMPVVRSIVSHIQNFVNWLNGLSDTSKKIIVLIATVVASIGPLLVIIGKIISAGGALVTGLGKVQGVIVKLQTAALAANTSIGGVLTQGIGKAVEAMKGMGTAVSSAITPLLKMAAPILPIVAAVGALIAIIKHLWDTNEEFRNKVTEIWENLLENIEQFVTGIKERLEGLGIDFEAAIEFIKGVWDGFCRFFAPIIEGAFAQVADTLSAVLDVLTGLLDMFIGLFTGNWEQFFQGIGEIAQAAGEFLFNTFENIGETILGILGISCEDIETTWEDVWEYIKQLPADIWEDITNYCENAFGNIADFFKNAWNNIVSFFKQGIPQFIADVGQWLNELPYNIGVLLGTIIGKVILWKREMVENAKDAIKSFVKEAIENIKAFPDKVKEWFDNTIKKVKEWKDNMKKEAKETAEGFIKSAIDYIKSLPDKIKEWFNNTIEKVKEWKDNMKEKAKEAIEGFIENVVEGAKSIPQKIPEIGKAIVDGIWKGIKDAKRKFVQDVKDFFDGIVDGVKSVLGIASPSKVMAKEVGQWIPKGVASGIEQNENTVNEAMDDMFDNITGRNKLGIQLVPNVDDFELGVINAPVKNNSDFSINILSEIANLLGVINNYMPELVAAAESDRDIYIDKKTLVGSTIHEIDRQIARIQKAKEQG